MREYRVPLLVERARLEAGLDVEDPQHREAAPDEHGVAGRRDDQRDAHERAPAHQPRRAFVERVADAADRGEGGDGQHRRRAVGDLEQPHQQHAAERGADQVEGVEPADVAREARQRQRHQDAAEDERRRDDRVGQHDRPDRDDRRMDAEGDRELGQEAGDDQDREQHAADGELAPHPVGREPRRLQVDDQGADGHPEHRHRDGDEGEVVPHGDAEDPGQQDLVHQRRKGDEGEPEGRAAAGRGRNRLHNWTSLVHPSIRAMLEAASPALQET